MTLQFVHSGLHPVDLLLFQIYIIRVLPYLAVAFRDKSLSVGYLFADKGQS